MRPRACLSSQRLRPLLPFPGLWLVAGAACLLLCCGAAQAQVRQDWTYCRALTIDNSAGSAALSDHQVAVSLVAPDFDFSRAAPDGADLRFVAAGSREDLSYWIETWEPLAGTATIWVRVPAVPAGGTQDLLMYYGNPTAPPASDGQATFLFFDDFEDFQTGGMNAPTYLVTPTYEGSGQVVHPDVVRIPGGWNGHEYWMAMTPYPGSNDDYENPSVIVSEDGLTWSEPAGISNPLAPEPAGHNDDPDMLLAQGLMQIYYNETNNDGNTYLSRLTSSDGIHWTGPDPVIIYPNYIMSPAVVFQDGVYRMWYLHSPGGCSSPYQDAWLRTSTDGTSWSAPQAVDLVQSGRVPWHLDVQPVDGGYAMIFISYPAGSSCGTNNLYYAESADGLSWTVTPEPLLTPAPGSWDSATIYRASFLIDGSWLRIWYSARSTGNQWRVGYTEGDLSEFVAPAQIGWDELRGSVAATTDHARSGEYGLREIGGSTYPQVFKNVAAGTGPVCFTAWTFDALSTTTDYMALLRMWDPGNATYPLHAIGTGLWMGCSTTHYSYHTEGWQYTPTGLPRSMGWHQLSIRVREATCDLLVNGQLAGSLDVLDETDISRLSLEGYRGGTGWFDDAYVRRYAHPDPVVAVGPEVLTGVADESGPVASSLALLSQPHPNPFSPDTGVRFLLKRPLPIRLQVFDLRGRLVRTLADEVREPGWHVMQWHGDDQQGRRAPAGTYLLRLQAGPELLTRKLLLTR